MVWLKDINGNLWNADKAEKIFVRKDCIYAFFEEYTEPVLLIDGLVNPDEYFRDHYEKTFMSLGTVIQ